MQHHTGKRKNKISFLHLAIGLLCFSVILCILSFNHSSVDLGTVFTYLVTPPAIIFTLVYFLRKYNLWVSFLAVLFTFLWIFISFVVYSGEKPGFGFYREFRQSMRETLYSYNGLEISNNRWFSKVKAYESYLGDNEPFKSIDSLLLNNIHYSYPFYRNDRWQRLPDFFISRDLKINKLDTVYIEVISYDMNRTYSYTAVSLIGGDSISYNGLDRTYDHLPAVNASNIKEYFEKEFESTSNCFKRDFDSRTIIEIPVKADTIVSRFVRKKVIDKPSRHVIW